MGWSKPSDISGANTDQDPALAGNAGELYLAYKNKGDDSQPIYICRYKNGSWGTPVDSGQRSDSFPALAFNGSDLYMSWKADDSVLHYGLVGLDLQCSDLGKVANAKSKQGPGVASWEGALRLLHIGETTGIAGRQIYQNNFNGTSWTDDVEAKDQKSKDAPALAATTRALYMFHRGETDGVGGNTIYWSQYSPDAIGWTTNGGVPDASAQHRPAAGAFGNDYLVLVHNGDVNHHLLWNVCDIRNNYKWTDKGTVGNSMGSYYGQALWYDGSTMFMAFVDKDKKVQYSTLSSL